MLWVIKTQQQGHFSNFPLPLLTKVAPAKAVHAHPGEGSSPALPPYISKGLHETWRKKKIYVYIFKSGSISTCWAENQNAPEKWRQTTHLNFKLTFFQKQCQTGTRLFTLLLWMALKLERAKNQLNREFPQSSRPLSFLLNIHVTPRHSGVSYMTDTLG